MTVLALCGPPCLAQGPRATLPGMPADIAAMHVVSYSQCAAALAPGSDWETAFAVRYTDPAKMRKLLNLFDRRVS